MKLKLSVLLIFILFAPQAFASVMLEREFTCPLDGHTFKRKMPTGATFGGMMLDLRRYGSVPVPPIVPACPNDGFLLYEDSFTEEELTILRAFVLSEEYQAMRETEVNYWLIAKCMEKLNATPSDMAVTFLQASWEAITKQQYARYAKAALAAWEALSEQEGVKEETKMTALMLIGEFRAFCH